MTRFVGIKNNNIQIVSNNPITDLNFISIEVPDQLKLVSSEDLIVNYTLKNGILSSSKDKKSRKDLKIAFVGNFKMQCGISTYNESLWGFVLNEVSDYRLFIERNNYPTGPIDELNGQKLDNKVIACWERGESLSELISEIKKFEPDIVWIGHEFGLWSNARYWMAMMTQLSSYRVIVTMHSVFQHKDKTIVEACMPEIVVHQEGAKDLLKNQKQIPGNVYVIPHGCAPCVDANKLWNFYKSNHTFMQFGFGFPYKNFEFSIKTAAILKKKYKDIFFTAIFSESPLNKAGHQLYYNELISLIDTLDMRENVAIIKGFQSEVSLDSFLRTNVAAVFPYETNSEHMVWGSTGAARSSMAKGIPVISSRANHFSDVPSIKADSPEEMAECLDLLFSNQNEISKQIEIQNKFLEDNKWEVIAEKYLTLFENP